MDWDAAQDGIARWLAGASGFASAQIAWRGEPVAHRAYPMMDLQLVQHQAERGFDDELLYVPDADGRLIATLVGNRTVSLTISVITRNHQGDAKAYAVLDRLRTLLFSPSALELFEALELTTRDVGVTQPMQLTEDMRDMSAASMTVALAYVVSEVDANPPIDPIESVVLGGDVEPGVGQIADHEVP
jgi:hypothetical protein